MANVGPAGLRAPGEWDSPPELHCTRCAGELGWLMLALGGAGLCIARCGRLTLQGAHPGVCWVA
eukprot:3680591-Alexandrium_andersonii.AAC.1